MKNATNFLRSIKIKKVNRNRRRNIFIFSAIIAFIIVLLAIPLLIYWPTAKNLYRGSLAIKSNLKAIESNIYKEDLSQALDLIEETDNLIIQAKADLKKLGFLKYIPIASSQYLAMEKVFSAGQNLTTAGQDILAYIVEIVEPFKKGSKISLGALSSDQKGRILGKVYDSQDLLSRAKGKVLIAADEMSKVSETGLISQLSEAVSTIKKYLPILINGLEQGQKLAALVPPLVGYPEQINYLFLLENNAELRPSGGFIGTYGVLSVKNGEIISFTTDNVYNLDEDFAQCITPPLPLTTYNKTNCWYLRDANWSPDFPTSARQSLWFYEKEGGTERNLHGVVAITPTFIESLIGLTGAITVDGISFTQSNFVDNLQYQVEKGFYQKGLEMSQRKEIIGDLSKILLDRVLAIPQEKWPDLWKIIDENTRNKQILLYLNDEKLENMVLEKNWAGSVVSSESDYFTFIDANLASLKTDLSVKRTINYYVKNENNKLTVNLQVVYKHEGNFDWKTTRYRTYFRLYVPKGSQLVDIIGTNEEKTAGEDLGKTYFGSFLSVEPQETQKLTFIYTLPDSIYDQLKNKEYALLVQKQAGTANYDFNAYFDLGRKVREFKPIDKVKKESNNNLSLKTSLSEDFSLRIVFK